MSISVRRPSDPLETPETKPAKGTKAPKPAKPPKPSKKAKQPAERPVKPLGPDDLVIGGDPRVDLLPPEVRSVRRNARTRRGFVWGVAAVFLVVIVASAAAFGYNLVAQTQLLAAQARTSDLLAQQQKYIGTRDVQKQVNVAEAAQQLAASTEVDWQPLLTQFQAARPEGMWLGSLKMDSISPLAVYQQSTDPLQGPRIGTVTIVAKSVEFPDTAAWLRGVLKVKGVVDAAPGTVNIDQSGIYTSTMTVHVSDSLYTKRFDPKGK